MSFRFSPSNTLFCAPALLKSARHLRASSSCLSLLLVGSIPSQFVPSLPTPLCGIEEKRGSSAPKDFRRDGAQPDVVLEWLDDEGQVAQSIGEDVWADDVRQTMSCPIMIGDTQTLLVHIKNVGLQETSFTLHLEGLPTEQGKPSKWPAPDWNARIVVDEDNTDLSAALQSPEGWQSAPLASGAEVVLRVTMTAPAKVEGMSPFSSFRFSSRCLDRSDAVVAQVGAQAIAKLRWNSEGDPDVEANWHDVTRETLIKVEQFTVLGMRAVKANPDIDWPSPTGNGPIWLWQGQEVHGETVFLLADKVTADIPNVATATCGNSHSVSVSVFAGDAFITYDPNEAR